MLDLIPRKSQFLRKVENFGLDWCTSERVRCYSEHRCSVTEANLFQPRNSERNSEPKITNETIEKSPDGGYGWLVVSGIDKKYEKPLCSLPPKGAL